LAGSAAGGRVAARVIPVRTARDVARRPIQGTPHMRHRLMCVCVEWGGCVVCMCVGVWCWSCSPAVMGQAHIPACAPPGHPALRDNQPPRRNLPGVLTPLSSHLRRLSSHLHTSRKWMLAGCWHPCSTRAARVGGPGDDRPLLRADPCSVLTSRVAPVIVRLVESGWWVECARVSCLLAIIVAPLASNPRVAWSREARCRSLFTAAAAGLCFALLWRPAAA